MFSKSDFQAWGKENVVLFASVTTKIKDRKNDSLLRNYGFGGFPSLALLDAEGNAITKKIGRNLNSMRAVSASAPTYAKMKKAVADGETVDKGAWFLARMDMGELKLKDAKTEIVGLSLPAEKMAAVQSKIFEMEVNAWFRNRFGPRQARSGQRGRRGQRGQARAPRTLNPKVVEQVHAAFKAGKRLPAGSTRLAFFEDTLLEAAKSKNDAAAFKFAFAGTRERAVKAIAGRETRVKSTTARAKQFADQPNRAKQWERRIESAKKSVETAKAKVVELDALAAKFAQTKQPN